MARERSVRLTEGDITTQLLKFIGPVFLAQAFQQFYNLANAWIVGNFVSTDALAAVSAGNPITLIYLYIFYGLGTGAGIIIANLYGADRKAEMQRTIDTAMVFSVVGGLGFTLVAELTLPFFMSISNIRADIWPLAELYLRIYLLGNGAALIYNMCFFVMRSLGDSRHPLYYLMISSAINVAAGVVMVHWLDMSVAGVAWATVGAQLVVDVLALARMARAKQGLLRIDIAHMQFDWGIMKAILKLGIPAGIQNMMIALSQMMVQSYVNLFPNAAIAGLGVASKLDNIAQVPMTSISTASTTFVGQNLGAGKYDRVQQGIRTSIMMSNVVMAVTCTAIFIFAEPLVASFNADTDVIYYGTLMVRHAIYSFIPLGWSHVYNGACRGAGNMNVPLIIAVTCQCVLRFAFVYLGLQASFSIDVIYWAEPVAFVSAGLAAWVYFRCGAWTRQAHLR